MLQMQKAVAVLMSFLLVLTTFVVEVSAENAPASGTQEEYGPLCSEELEGIIAPIALYPDPLVAQILGAATLPYEIVDATFRSDVILYQPGWRCIPKESRGELNRRSQGRHRIQP